MDTADPQWLMPSDTALMVCAIDTQTAVVSGMLAVCAESQDLVMVDLEQQYWPWLWWPGWPPLIIWVHVILTLQNATPTSSSTPGSCIARHHFMFAPCLWQHSCSCRVYHHLPNQQTVKDIPFAFDCESKSTNSCQTPLAGMPGFLLFWCCRVTSLGVQRSILCMQCTECMQRTRLLVSGR